ncbi:3-methyl-2-oxobutanoate hydroxymethyltransferase [Rhabdochromatium marinum]|uniref:3-methyl-2-oxobutanoate hydroxymethyltransferase n=1 Tax=Rhabdochromatium marinum TaxID=48729 RepID=UPI0019041093|nr:3-methyl-2-oxobutanoate hydroxymethyltransferase [Rhabdochromatium marinum]MBK1647435.1 3-methyl-2-oxobutanoate hydroxymethyltransferase [Rhabdochromatium marinum]
MDRITLGQLASMKRERQPIACLTCYDATFARLLEQAGVEVVLVGDSLGNVIQGHASTLPVSVDDMVYHTKSVARALSAPLLIADLPFLSYTTPAQALASAHRLMGEGGAQMVKLEGGAQVLDMVRALSDFGVPVCVHLGLLPQSVHRLGGYRYQGREAGAAERIRADARALQEAGAELLVVECVPAQLAGELRQQLRMPVIGIGAGADCDGQVLVLHDMLGAHRGRPPRFSRDFLTGQTGGLSGALAAYVAAVKSGAFPGPEQTLF